MGKLEQIKLEYEKALGIANKLYNELTNTPDGYLYKVIINSYGSRSTCDYINQYPVDSLVSEYGDGYDGLLTIYTTNPKYDPDHNYGCATINIINESELLSISNKDISKSQAFCNLISNLT